MKKILLIDQDDVMADFNGAAIEALARTPGIKYPQSQYKFFENLKPIPGAIETINKLREYFDVIILTRPSVINPLCYTEKRNWVENYFDFEMARNTVLAYDKTGQRGDFLIDDNIHTGRWEPEWEHIHFGSEEFLNWDLVFEYLIKKI